MTTQSKIKINLDSIKARREWKRHKVKDGHNVFRLLPPFGETSNGYPYRKWQIIWGLAGEDGRMRPFASYMTSEKKCPVTEFVKELKTKGDTIKAKMQAAGKSEDEVKDRLATLNKLVQDLNPKTVYVYNACDKAGEVGLLELKSTAHKKIKAEMLDYIQVYNQDPTSLGSADDDSGVWFDVVRSGLGRDTEYDAKKLQQRVKQPTGKISFEDDRSALPDNVIENYEKLAYDLGAIYQTKSYDELKEILDANMAALVALCPDADLSTDGLAVAPVVQKTPVTKAAGKVALKLDADDGDDEEEEKVPLARPTSKPAVVAAAVESDDDDFLRNAEALLNG